MTKNVITKINLAGQRLLTHGKGCLASAPGQIDGSLLPQAVRRWRRTINLSPAVVAFIFQAWCSGRVFAEDHVDYKFETYDEERNRIQVQTHSAFFEADLGSQVRASGEFVYDSISGATPTGAPPPAGSDQVPLAHMRDIRKAGNLGAAVSWGRNITTPQVAYSLENDYESIGVSLNHSIDFNEKNTTLTVGAAHNFDTVMPEFWNDKKHKDGTDGLIGLTQILGPKTLLSANLTVGYETGYLGDPYRGFVFTDYDPNALFAEKRPDHRSKQVLLVTLTQFVEKLNGSLEAAYRFHHDSYEVFSHTATLEWNQKIGSHVVVSPMARYYQQSSAYFYATQLPGDPTLSPSDPFFTTPIPDAYSADYRLSRFESYTYGISVTYMINSHVYLDAAYKRYEMHGLDNVTSASAYPKANVFTVGARIWF